MTGRITTGFWQQKDLAELNSAEWEALCDGCAQCCLIKLQDDETDRIYATNVACRLLDLETCRCTDYEHRLKRVEMCLRLSADDVEPYSYLPQSCAYRCLYEKRPLPQWHPLITGNKKAALESGFSIQSYAVSEEAVHPEQLEDHIISELI